MCVCGAGIWCTRHICRVTHRLAGPTHCGARLCVRDSAYMSGTTYNFVCVCIFLDFRSIIFFMAFKRRKILDLQSFLQIVVVISGY